MMIYRIRFCDGANVTVTTMAEVDAYLRGPRAVFEVVRTHAA